MPKTPKTGPPCVRVAHPAGRPIQLRYFCPIEQREIRVSTNTYDEAEAADQKAELEARLLLGLSTKPKRRRGDGPQMPWSEFRHEYRETQLVTLRPRSRHVTESRLDIAERILKPRTLADVADRDTLTRLQARLLAGDCGRFKRPRSKHTVKFYMASILAALGWAHEQGWLPVRPRVRLVKVAKLKAIKGRPITLEEFERMLLCVPKALTMKPSTPKTRKGKPIVPKNPPEPRKPSPEAVASWQHVLRGLWESGLRIDELMHVAWDKPATIQPVWRRGRLPVLEIPAALQKNDTEEAIPLLPGFEALLLETPEAERTGWAFNPIGWHQSNERPASEWAGKMISRIGRKAGILVDQGDPATGRPPKFASAHDLRRACAERMLDAGVPDRVVQRVLRHASFETTRRHYAPGDVQKAAGVLRMYLGTTADQPRKEQPAESQQTLANQRVR